MRRWPRSCAPTTPTDCTEVDTGGYRVTTTLDWDMQKIAEKWVYAAARAPHAKDPRADPQANARSRKPSGAGSSACAAATSTTPPPAVMDYRTGEVLAYVGSASYTSKGNKKFQPQFDVLADGWRQPGSSIKPIDYLIGIDDETLTASTMFMDVATNFGRGFVPTQADKLERGPVRLRSALQFSLNVPAIKATIMSGLDHVFDRTKDFGLDLSEHGRPGRCRWASARSRRTRSTCSARTARSPTAGCACRARSSPRSSTTNGQADLAARRHASPRATQVISKQAAYIITDILAGNTESRRSTRSGASGPIYEGGTPPAGRLQDGHDERQPRRPRLRLPGPAEGQDGARPRRRGVDGQQQQRARTRAASRSTPPRRSGRRSSRTVSKGDADREVQGPERAQDRHGRRVHRAQARAVHDEDGQGAVPAGHGPDRSARPSAISLEIDARVRPAVAGRLRRPEGRPRASSTSPRSRATSRTGRRPNRDWAARAAKGPGVRGGPQGHPDRRTSTAAASPRSAGHGARRSRRRENCPLAPPPCGSSRRIRDVPPGRSPADPAARPGRWPWRDGGGVTRPTPKPTKPPTTSRPTGRRPDRSG